MKILIVDDDPICRKVLIRLLQPFGLCTEAKDGREAIDAFRSAMNENQPYNLICLDVMMPDVDGRSALTQLRIMEEDRETSPEERAKIVMTTALSDRKDIEGAFRDDCDSYVTKPVRKDDLLGKLRQLGLIE